ncbi:MAG TPA: histidinol-phosphatase [Solirubrobacteraceae bacterium]|nr:histidinol-phosphatase [Solirubrobacteraceae bacterium]
MLTDYHVHLRADDLDARAADNFTSANARRYREAASARGISELGVSEHVYRFREALAIWEHPFWVQNAIDDLIAYCAFVREQTDLKLGLEVDYIPGREAQTRQLLERLELDYVIGSVHFVPLAGGGVGAVDMAEHGVWSSGAGPEEVWSAYFTTLGQAAASGLFDILAHVDLVKVFSAGERRPQGDLRRFYELALPAIIGSGVAVELSTAGLRKPCAELYPSRELLELLVAGGAPIALSSDAHRAQDLGYRYERALALLSELGVQELCVFERRRRSLAPIGAPGGAAAEDAAIAAGEGT